MSVTKFKRKNLQNLWTTGRDLESECDLVATWLEDSSSDYIKAVMVVEHIITKTFWKVENLMVAPLFEPFGFGQSDHDDAFEVVRVDLVEWSDSSYEEVKTISQVPPRLSAGVIQY